MCAVRILHLQQYKKVPVHRGGLANEQATRGLSASQQVPRVEVRYKVRQAACTGRARAPHNTSLAGADRRVSAISRFRPLHLRYYWIMTNEAQSDNVCQMQCQHLRCNQFLPPLVKKEKLIIKIDKSGGRKGEEESGFPWGQSIRPILF